MHKLILASCAGSSLVVTITIIADTSAQVAVLVTYLSHRRPARTACAPSTNP